MSSWKSSGDFRAPGGPQVAAKAARKPTLVRALLAALGPVLGLLGPLLGSLGALPGVILASREVPCGAFWVSFSRGFEKTRKLRSLTTVATKIKVFASPGGPTSSINCSEIALARVLATSWRSLGASRRCLGVSWRPLGALGASWAPLGALL